MKKIQYIILMLLASFTSCQQQEEMNENNDPNAVVINASIGEVTSLSRTAPTAPEAEDQWQAGDQIAISSGGASMVYTYGSTAWTATGGDCLKWTASTMTFTAYYPATTGTSATDFALPADQSSTAKIAKADYMTFWGDKTRKEGSDDVDLEFSRKMARVILNITPNREFDGLNPVISNVKINSAYAGYSYSAASGNTTAVTPCLVDDKYYALVIPTAVASSKVFVTLTVTYAGGTKDLTLTGIPELAVANSYTIALTAGKEKLSIGSVSVADWSNAGVIPGGEAESLVDVYAYFNSAEKAFQGKVYKNGEVLYNRAYHAIMKSGDDVYNIEQVDNKTAKIRKNNEEFLSLQLPLGDIIFAMNYLQPPSIAIFEGDIYMIAATLVSNYSYGIWKNNDYNAPPSFIGTSDKVEVYRLVALPDGVYAGAYSRADNLTYIYKVGESTPQYTFTGRNIICQMMPVGTDIYTGGSIYKEVRVGTIRKNDQVIFSSSVDVVDMHSEITAMKKVGNTLYFTELLYPKGDGYNCMIKVYKGDISGSNPVFKMISEIRPLQSQKYICPNDMAIAPNGDIYIAGYTGVNSLIPTVWKNGTVYRTYDGQGVISVIDLVSK